MIKFISEFRKLEIVFKATIHNVHENKFQEIFKFEYYCGIESVFIDL